MTGFMVRWVLIVLTACWVFGMALLAGGCTKYVPVEVQTPAPKPPAECGQTFVRPRAMQPIPLDPEARSAVCGDVTLAVCMAKIWAKRELAWQAAARRKDAADAVCRTFTAGINP